MERPAGGFGTRRLGRGPTRRPGRQTAWYDSGSPVWVTRPAACTSRRPTSLGLFLISITTSATIDGASSVQSVTPMTGHVGMVMAETRIIETVRDIAMLLLAVGCRIGQ